MAVSLPALASLTLLSGNKPSMDKKSPFTVSMPSARTSTFLRTSFLGIPSAPFYYPSSSLTGISLGLDIGPSSIAKKKKWQGLLVRAGKAGLGVTRRSRSRKSLARTHGFRLRMRTPNGRAVLKRRRAKGRKVLCTKTYPSSGKRATG